MKSERVENWWCGFEWCISNTEKLWSSNKFKKWNPFVTHEFPYETVILQKRLSDLYTKCVQFLQQPSQLFSTCYVGEMMIPCQLLTYSKFICSVFQFLGHLAQKISKCMKNTKWTQKSVENWWCGLEWCILNTQNVLSSNKFRKMKSLL